MQVAQNTECAPLAVFGCLISRVGRMHEISTREYSGDSRREPLINDRPSSRRIEWQAKLASQGVLWNKFAAENDRITGKS
jgi:hypothetical protein